MAIERRYSINSSGTSPISWASALPDTNGWLKDGTVGDTTTGYTLTRESPGSAYMNALIKFDAPVEVAKVTWQMVRSGISGNAEVHYSSDGISWSGINYTDASSSVLTFSTITAQYFQIVFNQGGMGTAQLTDFRAYNASDVEIVDASGASSSSSLSSTAVSSSSSAVPVASSSSSVSSVNSLSPSSSVSSSSSGQALMTYSGTFTINDPDAVLPTIEANPGTGWTGTTVIAGNATTHIHSIGDVTDLQSTLNNKAALTHTHAISDVTNLQGQLDSKLTAANNLSDVINVATARTNLGLGTAATTNTGPGATNTILGNDARLTDTRTPTAGSVVDASVSASAAIAWSKISKTGSNLSEIATRNFADLQNKPTTLTGYGITDAGALSVANTWTNTQTINTTAAVSGVIVSAVNGYGLRSTVTGTGIAGRFVSTNTTPVELSALGWSSDVANVMIAIAARKNGAAANGFGSRILTQLESSTTNERDASAIDTVWTDATDATRTSELRESTVKNGTMTEVRRSDHLDSTTQTNLWLRFNGAMVRVEVGAVDSGGAGYRMLRIPN